MAPLKQQGEIRSWNANGINEDHEKGIGYRGLITRAVAIHAREREQSTKGGERVGS